MTQALRGTRAAGYLRVSTERDGMQAPAIYEGQIREQAKKSGCSLIEPMFSDLDYSGRKGSKERPGFKAMQTAAANGEFDLLIVPTLSRLGRSVRDNVAVYDDLESWGVALVTCDLKIDTTTASGRLIRGIMTDLAEFESDLISDRWKAAKRHAVLQGRHVGATPYGYSYDKEIKNLVPHPAQAPIVGEVFERFLAGDSIKTITYDLQARGVHPGRKAARWWDRHVGAMLDRCTYAGLALVDGELIEGAWEPIITTDTFEQVQTLRKANKARMTPPRKDTGAMLLSGLLKCPKCGNNQHRHGGQASWQSYRCSKCVGEQVGIGSLTAHKQVTEAFLNRVQEPFGDEVDKLQRGDFPKAKPVADFDAQLAAIDAKVSRLIDMSLDATGAAAKKAFTQKLAALEAERTEIEQQSAITAADQQQQTRRVEDIAELRAIVKDLPKLWDGASVEEQRKWLGLCIDKVTTVPDSKPRTVTIEWSDWLR